MEINLKQIAPDSHSCRGNRVGHWFFAAVLESLGFEPEFHRLISIQYQFPTAVVQVNGIRSESFVIGKLSTLTSTLHPHVGNTSSQAEG